MPTSSECELPNSARVLITGVTSIHGWPVFQKLHAVLGDGRVAGVCPPRMVVRSEAQVYPLCITDSDALEEIREAFKPTHVVHCAGVCDLDVCEERPEWAASLNVDGTRAITSVFGERCSILHISTDLVFSGTNPPEGGYRESDRPDPISVAGKTFAQAEAVVAQLDSSCTIRLGLPLGDSFTGGKGAVDWIESRFKRGLPVTLFHDEYRSCVSGESIGLAVARALRNDMRGLYHFGGKRSWSLVEIGEYVLGRGPYPPALLNGIMRREERNGPPRIGDVSLNSEKLLGELGEAIRNDGVEFR